MGHDHALSLALGVGKLCSLDPEVFGILYPVADFGVVDSDYEDAPFSLLLEEFGYSQSCICLARTGTVSEKVAFAVSVLSVRMLRLE